MGFFTTIFGLSDEEATNRQVAEHQTQLLADQRARGVIDQVEFNRAVDNAKLEDVNAAAAAEFDSAWWQGVDDLRTGASTAIGNTLKTGLGIVPSYVWLGLAVAAFVYLGGWKWITKKVLKR